MIATGHGAKAEFEERGTVNMWYEMQEREFPMHFIALHLRFTFPHASSDVNSLAGTEWPAGSGLWRVAECSVVRVATDQEGAIDLLPHCQVSFLE